jgi:hypothetical protein
MRRVIRRRGELGEAGGGEDGREKMWRSRRRMRRVIRRRGELGEAGGGKHGGGGEGEN